jgi:hypothetical protein
MILAPSDDVVDLFFGKFTAPLKHFGGFFGDFATAIIDLTASLINFTARLGEGLRPLFGLLRQPAAGMPSCFRGKQECHNAAKSGPAEKPKNRVT